MVKKYIGFAIIFIMVLHGCTNENPLENPIPNETNKSSVIHFPQAIKAEVGLIYSASNNVDGAKGGTVILDTVYEGSSGPVEIFAEIKFKSGAFIGSHLVTMMIDNVSGTVSFDPPSVFVKPANLDMKLAGINLSGLDENNISFVYINPNGNLEPVWSKDIIVNISENRLELKDGEIHHFSRYGWAR